jgi:Sulfotransferase family
VSTLNLGGRSIADWTATLRRNRWLVHVLAPAPLRYLFVLAYGRSGSTLVQGLLNTIPRTLVRGENNLFILPIFRSMVSARAFQQKYGKGTIRPTSAFFGLPDLRPDVFADVTRDLVVKQLLGSVRHYEVDVIGFKEVRWNRIREDEQGDFFDFMDRAFPGAQYVLNQRNVEDVARSGFWRGQMPEAARNAVRRVEEIHEHLRITRPERILDIRYEQLTGDDESASEKQLRALAEFVVGSCDEELLAAMRKTLAVGHGPNPFGRSRRGDPG